MNSVNLMGRLTTEPELKTTPNGTNVCSFSVAVNRQYKNQDGSYTADFINCVAWKQTGEFISRYFHKGNMIGLSGSIQTRQYQDKDTGKNRTAFEVNINSAFFAESKQDNSANTAHQSYSVQPQAFTPPQPQTYSQGSFATNQFTTADLDGFRPIVGDDGDLPF